MWNWLTENSQTIHVAILFFGLLGGAFGLYLATVRSRISDRNLLRERYQMGMQLFSLNQEHYTARVSGASILSEILLDKSSDEYDASILRAFESCLYSPAVFGGDVGDHQRGEIDYESRETYLVVSALRRYLKKPNALPLLPLPQGLVFTITENTVQPNEDHGFYKRWMNARNRPPKYSE